MHNNCDKYVPGLAGVPVIESSISLIDGKKGMLFYRGYAIDDLVQHSSFEEVSFLLNNGDLPKSDEMSEYQKLINHFMQMDCGLEGLLASLDQKTHPMHVLQSVFPLLNMHALEKYSHDQMQVFLLVQAVRIIAMWERIRTHQNIIKPIENKSLAENFLYMLSGEHPNSTFQKIMDACFILHAEHSTNASTFADLVVASTLAKPCSVISSAIGALSGPLHGGANERVLQMLGEIDSVDHVQAYVEQKLSKKEVIWGMGHREYLTKDPRAIILEKMIKDLLLNDLSSNQSDDLMLIALEVEKVCFDRLSKKGIYPNVDFYSGIVYQKIGIRPDLFTAIFALSRISGWYAHFRQQVDHNKIFRPTQIYVGHQPRHFK